ncbi:MAG: glycine cleavage system protein H [Planctomycetes bacterium]|nr:glycine cleavage system protein H [Planctomycetota bacterium]
MAEDWTFMMGKFPAVLPGDLLYARNHMWCRRGAGCQPAREDGRLAACPTGGRFGFTSYAIRLMQDVYFLEWHLSDGDAVEQLQQIGNIETSKAESALYAPLTGTITAFNKELLKDPSGINVDGYGGGWLFEMDADAAALLRVDQYHQFLEQGWEKTQRYLKGKINTED